MSPSHGSGDAREDQLRRLRDALRHLPSETAGLDHLGPETVAAYVDGILSPVDAEIVEGHLDACELCAGDVADLRAVQRQLSPAAPTASRSMSGWVAAAAVAAVVVLAVVLWPTGERVDVAQVPAPTAAPRLVLRDGPRDLRIEADGTLSGAGALPTADRTALLDAIRTGTVQIPAEVSTLRAASGTLLGPSDAPRFAVVSPAATAVIEDRPTFRWQPHPAAQGYTVSIFDEQFNRIATSPRVTSTDWQPSTALPAERTLLWQVTAHTSSGDIVAPAPPAAEARFRVLSQDAAARLQAAAAAHHGSPVTLGILYARAGVLDRAERELNDALIANPDAAVVTALRNQVAAARR